MSVEITEGEVLASVRDGVGTLTLNRPKALNALTLDMIREFTRVLRAWADDDAVRLVLVRGAGERGLCAGGDIAALYRDAVAEGGPGDFGATFWREEYELNHYISVYPKPYVALQTGIVLGGGIGISAHGSHRIVTDDSRLGMPEVGIGYSPDAGGSYVLARAADRLGFHLGYTAAHVGAAEAIDTGFADYYVPQDQIEPLVARLHETADPAVIAEFTQDAGPGFGEDRAEMVEVYAAPTADATLERLDVLAAEHGEEHWAAKAAKRIRRNSPLGIRVTEEGLERAAQHSLADVLTQEFWMSLNMQRHPEFAEGIRAQIIDKDRSPHWKYATIADVPGDVGAIFAPIDGIAPPDFTKNV